VVQGLPVFQYTLKLVAGVEYYIYFSTPLN